MDLTGALAKLRFCDLALTPVKHIGQAAPKTGHKTAKSKWLQEHSARNCGGAGGARLFATCSAKRPAFWGPERGPQNGGRRSCSLSFLRTGAGGARFWGRFLDPKTGAAFCVKIIAEAECAMREHVSARERACPKLLVVGRSLCSALVPKGWPSADRGGPSRGFGFCYRLWTSFWGAESGSSFGRRQVACSLIVGLRARAASRPDWLACW